MTFLSRLFRCLCVCICVHRGSWSPKNDNVINKNRMIIQKRLKDEKYKKYENNKPEWLKQWTISKGWMHDRSHMLTLGVSDSSELIVDQSIQPNIQKNDESSSVSNPEDLISILEGNSPKLDTETNTYNTKSTKIKSDIDFDKIEVDTTDIYSEISVNYRKTFPVAQEIDEKHTSRKHYDTFKLKKYLTAKESGVQYSKIIFPSRQKLFRKTEAFKVDKYKTFDDLTLLNYEENEDKNNRTTGKRNSRIFSSEQFRRNLQPDTIYECSEDSFSLYNNPIYESNKEFSNVRVLDSESNIKNFFDFNRDTSCKFQKYLHNDLNTNRLLSTEEFVRKHNFDSMKSKSVTDKYIIRHIRIRIMLTLRLRKFQRLYRKRMKSKKKVIMFNKKKLNSKVCESAETNLLRHDILKVHEEQRRIGNGKTSLKIQNLRYVAHES